MKKYQQGDVVLMKVTKEEYIKHTKESYTDIQTTFESRVELAYGEETGHCHAIYLEDMLEDAGITLHRNRWGEKEAQALHIKKGKVTIRHEEHNPITIPQGYYIQRIVKEFDPISGQIRGVLD